MAKRPIPTLSAAGWVDDIAEKMALLFAHALVADYSQSNLYSGSVTSLQHIAANHPDSPEEHATALQGKLRDYYRRYFDTVEVDVTITDDDTTRYTMELVINVTDNGTVYSLAKSVIDDPHTGLREVIRAANR